MLKLKKQRSVGHNSPYPTYSYLLNDKAILSYSAPKRNIYILFKRYRLGLTQVPKGATILPTKADRKPYDKKFLGGWSCKSRSLTYGIYIYNKDEILTRPIEDIYWALSDEEIERFTNYKEIKGSANAD